MKTKLFFKVAILALFIISISPCSTAVAQGVKVVVIDPGHGGKFPGAYYKGHTEKSINLNVALKLGEMLKKGHPELKIVYTRTTDKELANTIKDDLAIRSKIANEASGDLFISIHANAAGSTAAYGAETIIMGESSLEKTRNDAALYSANQDYLIDMSNEKTAAIVRAYIQNLQFTYGQYSEALARLINKSYGAHGRKVRGMRKQPIMVLYGTDMPCVLTEIGFMSNPEELAHMTSTKGAESIAKSIYDGIHEYIVMVNRTAATTASAPSTKPSNSKSTSQKSANQSTKGYTIQILSSKKALDNNDRQFKNFAGKQWLNTSSGKYMYKYCVGKYNTKAEAEANLANVRKSFKDAFIVEFNR